MQDLILFKARSQLIILELSKLICDLSGEPKQKGMSLFCAYLDFYLREETMRYILNQKVE